MNKIAVLIGTRPEAIKMAPVIAALNDAEDLAPITIATGQHREMFAQVVDTFGIRIECDLDVMQPDQGLASLTARLITGIDGLLVQTRPDMVLVQGDTTTVFSAALASFYRRIPLGHVEAGLRTGNIWAPFPEEANRRLSSLLVTLHFAPTARALQNLLAEGVPPGHITVTGNTIVDALHMELRRQQSPEVRKAIHDEIAALLGPGWECRPYVLITGHRRENFGEGFAQICAAVAELARRFPTHRWIYPVHLNPNVQEPVGQALRHLSNVTLIPPQNYSRFVMLMGNCQLILTDSGGVQEEAPSLGKPVLVMRDATERPEGIEAGTALLVGADASHIVSRVERLLTDPSAYQKMAAAKNPYGDGQAATRIVAGIRAYFRLN